MNYEELKELVLRTGVKGVKPIVRIVYPVITSKSIGFNSYNSFNSYISFNFYIFFISGVKPGP